MNPMHNPEVPPAQALLIECLERQEQHYQAATAIIAELKVAGEAGLHGGIAKLQKHLADVRTTGAAVQKATDAWASEGQPRCSSLSAALIKQEQQILSFLETINSLHKDFTSMKQRMQPQLDNDATRRSMHQAYQRSLRTG